MNTKIKGPLSVAFDKMAEIEGLIKIEDIDKAFDDLMQDDYSMATANLARMIRTNDTGNPYNPVTQIGYMIQSLKKVGQAMDPDTFNAAHLEEYASQVDSILDYTKDEEKGMAYILERFKAVMAHHRIVSWQF